VASDPTSTQRDAGSAVVADLCAVGFEDPEEIGHGGFGVVYRCTQPALDRTVAVKVLTATLHEDRERFLREQRAMGRLTGHPNIVGVLEVGETPSGYPYLVMQYHRHDSLDARIRRSGPLPLRSMLRLGVRMAGALETAHRLGVLHRDVKPGNILFTDFAEPALTDFGIAHIPGAFTTTTGSFTGSPAFTAPEVISGNEPTAASDVYGLGATLFCALTGHAAFERRRGEQLVAQFLRITTQTIPDLRESDMPDDVAAVVQRAMSRDPRNRPAVMALGEELQQIQQNHGLPVDEMALRPGSDAEQLRERVVVTGRDHLTMGNLPLELSSFIGRGDELADVERLLSETRLVTLTGIGGVGKTRLALRTAMQIRKAFADGAWLVELGELRDGSLLVNIIASALGLREQSPRPLRDVLTDFVSARQMLLVLDNCEQVIDEVAKLGETLLRGCPNLRILATSREPLDIAGESVVGVSPLGFPDVDTDSLEEPSQSDAVELFAERAAAAVPGFHLTVQNRPIVARICARLDGLPLPIELAAARLRAMSPEQLLQRLSERYNVLNRGSRLAPARQQGLEWSIGWSYDLCTPAERQLWSQLSIFAGTFDLDAAEHVCGDDLSPDELIDLLSALVDKSILIRTESHGALRFRVLETLRAYGKQKIADAGAYLRLRQRHRDFYERMAMTAQREWFSPHQVDWIARIETELPNLREALEFSLTEGQGKALRTVSALLPFYTSRGFLSEGRRVLDRALADESAVSPDDRATGCYGAAILAVVHGDLRAAQTWVARAQALIEDVADPTTRVFVAYADVVTGQLAGELDHGITALKAALDAGGDPIAQAAALLSLGWADEMRGDIASALAYYGQVLALSESQGETINRTNALWSIGIAKWRVGAQDEAMQSLRQALQYARDINDRRAAAACLEALAWTAVETPRTAMVLLAAADKLRRSVGSIMATPSDVLVYHRECEERIRQALAAEEVDVAREEGNSLGFNKAVEYALRMTRTSQVAGSGVEP